MSYGPIACFGVTCEVEMAFTFLMVEIKFKTRIIFVKVFYKLNIVIYSERLEKDISNREKPHGQGHGRKRV